MAQTNDAAMATRNLLRSYYDGLARGTDWGALLTDEFLLTGTVPNETRSRDAYVGNSFFKLVRGLRVEELITEGTSGFALVSYDLVSPKGTPFSSEVAELWKVQGGKLGSVAIYFDTSAFAKSLAQ